MILIVLSEILPWTAGEHKADKQNYSNINMGKHLWEEIDGVSNIQSKFYEKYFYSTA